MNYLKKGPFYARVEKKLLCNAHWKYLIKILITQDFLKQSDQLQGIQRVPSKDLMYDLSVCNFAFDSYEYEGATIDYPFDRFEAEVHDCGVA